MVVETPGGRPAAARPGVPGPVDLLLLRQFSVQLVNERRFGQELGNHLLLTGRFRLASASAVIHPDFRIVVAPLSMQVDTKSISVYFKRKYRGKRREKNPEINYGMRMTG